MNLNSENFPLRPAWTEIDLGKLRRNLRLIRGDLPRDEAEAAIGRAAADHTKPIVTTIEGPDVWYPAEDYHQEYWEGEGQRNPYCLAVIPPKLQKLHKIFADKVKV